MLNVRQVWKSPIPLIEMSDLFFLFQHSLFRYVASLMCHLCFERKIDRHNHPSCLSSAVIVLHLDKGWIYLLDRCRNVSANSSKIAPK